MSKAEYLSIGKPEMCDFKLVSEPYWFSSTPPTTPTSSTRTVPAKSPSYYFWGCDAFSLFSSLFAQERPICSFKASPLTDSYSDSSFWLFALFVESSVASDDGMISAALIGSVCFSRTLRLFCSSLCVDYNAADSSYKLVSESYLSAFGSLKSSCCVYASSLKPSLDFASPNLGVPLIKSKKSMNVLSRLNK